MGINATPTSAPKRPWPFLVGKILVLQTIFYWMAKLGPHTDPVLMTTVSIGLLLINYLFVKRLISLKHYAVMMILFYASGFVQDTILIYFDKVDMGGPFPPLWIACLWLLFLGYYGDVFRKMLDFPIWLSALLGSAGGTLAYHRGLAHSGFILSTEFYCLVAIIWAAYMPFSLRLFRYFMRIKS